MFEKEQHVKSKNDSCILVINRLICHSVKHISSKTYCTTDPSTVCSRVIIHLHAKREENVKE